MNPDTGDMRQLVPDFTEEKAIEEGYTEIFNVGEIVKIKGMFFEVNNFVTEHNFMNLKSISKVEAELRDLT